MDWSNWNKEYDASPSLRARLKIVQRQIAATLDECAPGEIKIISICAGDGRDLIGALEKHPRRNDANALLLDLNAELISRGKTLAAQLELGRQLHFVEADASFASSYGSFGHADLVLASGMLGHLRPEGVSRLIKSLPMLCKSNGSVIWNRHRTLHNGARQIKAIREQFQSAGFDEMQLEITQPDSFAVGRVRFRGTSVALDTSKTFFDFIGLDRLLDSSEANAPARVEPQPTSAHPPGFAADMNVEQSIPACFDRVAELFAERPAIVAGDWQPSYRELKMCADSLARALAARGAPGDRVGILMRHDGPQIATVLAALKAGRVVVVMNPTDPPARLNQVVADAEPTLIVADSPNRAMAEQIAGKSCAVVWFDEILPGATEDKLNFQIPPNALAFIVYTSGSTGRPKGVMQTHRNILHNIFRLTRGMKLSAADRVVLLASLSGAQGVATTWCALLNGAALCPFSAMERGVTGLKETMLSQAITVYVSSASLFRHFMRTLAPHEILSPVRLVRLGAESSTAEDFAQLNKHFDEHCILFHSLSSSETGYISQLSLAQHDRVAPGKLPVGRAAEGVEIILHDDRGSEVRTGETGEIVVRSRYLSPGYWRNEALTAQKFSADGTGGIREFSSGDLGCRREDGLLMHQGRKDGQVKIRGYRVELSEVEDALARAPEVEKAAVCAVADDGEDKQLVAYIVPRRGSGCTAERLRNTLQPVLPAYMVPAGFVFLQQFPLTPHGKIDREALKQIEPQISKPKSPELPASETEILLAGIWKEVFKRDFISRRDNFFDLGGDSLNAAVVAARIYDALKIELQLRLFAEHPTLAELAAAIDELRRRGGAAEVLRLSRAPRNRPLPMSFEQERTWRHAQKSQESTDAYNVSTCYRLVGALDVDVLRECMNVLVRRHETLRTTFDEIAGQPVQVIQPADSVSLAEFDVSGAPDAEDRARKILRENSRQVYDLRNGPLIRFWLVKIRAGEHWLLSVTHHIILDAWSWRVFFGELGALYEARLSGKRSPITETEPVQYADYAVWQRQVFRAGQPALAETIEWWRKNSAPERRLGGLFRARPRATKLPLKRLWRSNSAKPSDGVIWWGIQPETSRRLDQIGRDARATYFMTRLAVFAALAAIETRRDEVILGTYMTNRNRVELQNMFGFFANLTVLRMRFNPSQTFREWLSEVRGVVIETKARAEIPYEELRRELREAGVKPLKFRAVFAVSDHTSPIRFGGLELTWQERRMEVMPDGFNLTFDQYNEDRRCCGAFDARIYDPAKVRGFIGRLTRLLDAVSVKPDSTLAGLADELVWKKPASKIN